MGAEPYDIEHDPWARQPQPGDGVPPEMAGIIGDWVRDRGPDWAGTGFQGRRPAAEREPEREAG